MLITVTPETKVYHPGAVVPPCSNPRGHSYRLEELRDRPPDVDWILGRCEHCAVVIRRPKVPDLALRPRSAHAPPKQTLGDTPQPYSQVSHDTRKGWRLRYRTLLLADLAIISQTEFANKYGIPHGTITYFRRQLATDATDPVPDSPPRRYPGGRRKAEAAAPPEPAMAVAIEPPAEPAESTKEEVVIEPPRPPRFRSAATTALLHIIYVGLDAIGQRQCLTREDRSTLKLSLDALLTLTEGEEYAAQAQAEAQAQAA